MKKIISLLLVLAMMLALAACGASAPAATEAPATEAPATEAPATEAPATEAPTEAAPTVDTMILMEADSDMLNTYSVIAVNPEAKFVDADGKEIPDVYVNTAGADALVQWLLSEEALKLATEFGMGDQFLFYQVEGAPVYTGEIPAATEETKAIRLSTTTSVKDSGLWGVLEPAFEEKYGYELDIASAGTGKAIQAAKDGNADLILVHSKSQEEAFIEAGFGRVVPGFEAERISFLYNYFVLCGPSTDPAGVLLLPTVKEAFAAIAAGEHPFISRGDNSGTHTKELALWPAELGIAKEAETFKDYTGWYTSANTGMGACLVMAEEMGAYILTDKATFLTFQANGGVM